MQVFCWFCMQIMTAHIKHSRCVYVWKVCFKWKCYHWAIPERIQTVVVDFSEPHPPGIVRFVTLPLVIRNFGENKLSPLEILKIIPRQKPRPMEWKFQINQTEKHLLSFYLTPGIYTCSFFNIPRNSMPSAPIFFFFFFFFF